MTTAQILWRLTWKEYRVQRALWWAVLILTLIVEGLAGLTLELLGRPPLTGTGHLVVVFGAVAIYLLGCGATLFALEVEQGTFDFQRILPSRPWEIFAAKIGVGYLSGLVLGGALLIPTLLFPASVLRETMAVDWWSGWVTFTEIYLWSALFSLLLRDPLRAAVCGIFGASIMACALFPLLNQQSWTEDIFFFHRGSLGPRSLATLVLLLANVGLARRWFRGGTLTSWLPSPRDWLPTDLDLVLRPAGPAMPKYLGSHRAGLGRLVGIAWRQGKWIWMAPAVLSAAALIASLGNDASRDFLVLAWFFSLILYSWCSFGLDQRGNQFRFYAERGIDPRWLWLSRHVVWFIPLLLMAFVVQLHLLRSGTTNPSRVDSFMNQLGIVVFTLMAYSVGQLWAMAIRRALLAFVVIVFSTLSLFFWLAAMVQGDVPWWLSLLPIPVVCLYATWRFGANWIEERRGKRRLREVCMVFGVPSAIVLPAIATHRAYSIPAIPPAVVVSEYTRAMTESEQETLSFYTQAHQELAAAVMATGGKVAASSSKEAQSLAAAHHDRVVSLLRTAHQRPRVPVTLTPQFVGDEPKSKLGNFDALPMVDVLNREALHMTSQGKLAEAWQVYEMAFELLERIRLRGGPRHLLHADGWESTLLKGVVEWSNHRDQSPATLAGAQQRLAEWDREANSGQGTLSRLVKVDYVLWDLFLRGDSTVSAELGLRPDEASIMRGLMWLLPWEASRCQRLSDHLTFFALSGTQDPTRRDELVRLRESTLPLLSNRYPSMPAPAFEQQVGLQVDRRAARILVALITWRREHGGKLPGQLQDLERAGSAVNIVHPGTQRPFLYSAGGASRDVWDPRHEEIILPKETPFLWSPGYSRTFMEETSPGTFHVRFEVGMRPINDLGFDQAIMQGLLWVIPPYQPPSPHP